MGDLRVLCASVAMDQEAMALGTNARTQHRSHTNSGGVEHRATLDPDQEKSEAPHGRSAPSVEVTGFEPATPCTPCKCATGLRYTSN